MSKKTNWAILSVLVVLAMVLVSCAPAPTAAPQATQPPAAAPTQPPAAAPTQPPAPAGSYTPVTPPIPGGALEAALQGKYKGTTVVMDGPFSSGDQVKFMDSVKAFMATTGITINYIGGKGFESEIAIRVDGGNAPDIADFPQPASSSPRTIGPIP